MILLWSLLACTDKDATVDDTADTATTSDAFPCDADYFPVDFNARRFQYTEYKGRFEQPLSTGYRQLEFQSLYSPSGDTGETAVTTEDGIIGCVFNLVVPLGYGTAYTVYGIDDDWVYVMADGDSAGGGTFHPFEDPIPLIPLDPVEGWSDVIDANYLHADFEDNQRAVVDARVIDLDESITVPAGTYEALKMTWEWNIIDGTERIQMNLDITAYFDKEEGLVRQSWYDATSDSSGLIEFEGY